MKSPMAFRHEFIQFIPEDLQESTVYVSMRFATVAHLCACGCRNKVVTPLKPSDWQLTFDGKTISLYPSIGNWSFPCRSHYWIKNNTIQWAEDWSQERIEAGRMLDRERKRPQGVQIVDAGSEPFKQTNSVKRPWWKKLTSLPRIRR